eukprot:jgi/Undpi1/10744/HiC_scaffold_29.g13192.m1
MVYGLRVSTGHVAVTQVDPASDGAGSRDVLHSLDVARTRYYLNALVDASVSSGDNQLSNLAFLKTHKTGSTTLSSLFYRYGVRHGLKVARYDNGKPLIGKPLPLEVAFPKILEQCNGRVDIMHYHIGTSSRLGYAWDAVAEQYKTIMRDPDNINFVTVFREPRSHFLSYYYYFVARKIRNKSVEQFLLEPSSAGAKYWESMHNPVAGELGITTQQELDDFVENSLPKFKLVLLTDRFAEGLMLLRNMFRWHLIDMSYIVLNQTSTRVGGRKGQEARKLGAQVHRPVFDELSIEAQQKIDELTSMDRAIYEAGKVHFEKTLAPLADQVEADVAGFNSLQELVAEYLDLNRTSLARNLYTYEDIFHSFPPASAF